MKISNVTKFWTRTEYSPNLTQKAFLNAIAAFLDYGAKIGVSLLVTPVLVSGLGSTLFGVWQILNRLVNYISFADGRPTQALKWVIANSQASGDFNAKRRAVGSALGVWLISLPFLIAAGLIVAWFSPTIAKVPPEWVRLVRITCLLLVINLILTILAGIPESVLRGMNLGYKRMGVMASLNAFGGALTVGAIYLNWGLIGVALAQVFVVIVTGILFWYLVKFYVPWFGVARVSVQEIRQFFRLNIWYAAWNMVNNLLLASDVVILGWVLTASTVTSYVLTGYAVNTVLTIATMMVGAAIPGLGVLFARREYERIVEMRYEIIWLACLLCTITGSSVLLWNHSFMRLWVGDEYYGGTWINLLLVLMSVQLLFIRNDAFLINLTLKVEWKTIIGLLSTLASIGLALPLTSSLGVIGLCLAFLAGRSIMTITYPMIVGKLLDLSSGVLKGVMVRPLLLMMGLFAVSAFIGHYVSVNNWLELSIWGGLSALVVFLIQFFGGFSVRQQRSMLQRVRHLIRV